MIAEVTVQQTYRNEGARTHAGRHGPSLPLYKDGHAQRKARQTNQALLAKSGTILAKPARCPITAPALSHSATIARLPCLFCPFMHYLRALFSALLTTAFSLVALLGLAVLLAGLALYHLRPDANDWQTQLQIPLPSAVVQALDGQASRLLPTDWRLRAAGVQAPTPAQPVQPTQPAGNQAIATLANQSKNKAGPAASGDVRARLLVPIGIAAAVDWVTSPNVARMLGGTQWNTPYGPMAFEWDSASQTQTMQCSSCSAALPALGANAVNLPELHISIQRQAQHLQGQLRLGALEGRWSGELGRQQLDIALHFDEQPIRYVFEAFVAQIPEVAKAEIDGTVALEAQLSLPSWKLEITPVMKDFRVQGLGTEALPLAKNQCTRSSNKLPIALDGFLARAVIATEDQRFYMHPGYDLAAWQESLQHNQARTAATGSHGVNGGQEAPLQALRGGSTLTQQLAKFVYTNGDRTALRKLRELLYAVELESSLGKQGVLQQYLERVYWGEGICGAQEAAQHYFGQSPNSLNPAQAAWLAAMLHRPDYHAQRWQESGRIDVRRTQWVIGQMRMQAPQRLDARDRQQWQRFVSTFDWRRNR